MGLSMKNFLFVLLSFSLVFASCKEDDEKEVHNVPPEDIIDENHVKIDNRYGITAICEKGEWTNEYVDTMPAANRDYYKDVLFSSVTLALKADSLRIGNQLGYMSSVILTRFLYSPTSDEDAERFMDLYKETSFEAMEGYYYDEISDFELTKLNGYEAKHFSVVMNPTNAVAGKQEFFLMYHNGRVYSAGLSVSDGYEESYDKCMSVLNTVQLK